MPRNVSKWADSESGPQIVMPDGLELFAGEEAPIALIVSEERKSQVRRQSRDPRVTPSARRSSKKRKSQVRRQSRDPRVTPSARRSSKKRKSQVRRQSRDPRVTPSARRSSKKGRARSGGKAGTRA